jgi:flagellar basal-body rod protein FlgB
VVIRETVFGSKGWGEARRALDAGALRQRVIASNLANVATPGYQAKEVVFEELLTGESTRLQMERTQPGHLAAQATAGSAAPQVIMRGGDLDASGVNDVSVEREMTELTENTIHFQALSQFLANKYRAIRDAIRPGA